MARVNQVLKSRKENKCSCCGEVIPVGSPYKWISFNFGPTIVRCNSCGFKPYETTANEYARQVGQLSYEFENDVEKADSLESLEELRDSMVSSLEEVRDELDDKRSNLPDQFQDSGPGEIITERIDNLDDVISDLENVEFNEADEDTDFESMLDKVVELEGLNDEDVEHLRNIGEDEEDKEWTQDKVLERYQEWVEEQVEEVKKALNDAMSNLEY